MVPRPFQNISRGNILPRSRPPLAKRKVGRVEMFQLLITKLRCLELETVPCRRPPLAWVGNYATSRLLVVGRDETRPHYRKKGTTACIHRSWAVWFRDCTNHTCGHCPKSRRATVLIFMPLAKEKSICSLFPLKSQYFGSYFYAVLFCQCCKVFRTRKCHRNFAQCMKKGLKWHFVALYGIFTNREITKKMPFFPENGIEMPIW